MSALNDFYPVHNSLGKQIWISICDDTDLQISDASGVIFDLAALLPTGGGGLELIDENANFLGDGSCPAGAVTTIPANHNIGSAAFVESDGTLIEQGIYRQLLTIIVPSGASGYGLVSSSFGANAVLDLTTLSAMFAALFITEMQILMDVAVVTPANVGVLKSLFTVDLASDATAISAFISAQRIIAPS
jgi:hypothetical protein